MSSEPEMEKPFFHRHLVKQTIVEICRQKELAIFGGAGVTIDRSGLDWRKLIGRLLILRGVDEQTAYGFLDSSHALTGASVVMQMYQDAAGDELAARNYLESQLRTLLYIPEKWQEGRLANAIARFAYVWAGSDSQRWATIATTNYDDFIYEELLAAHEYHRRRDTEWIPPTPTVIFPTQADPLTTEGTEYSLPSDRNRSNLEAVYFHGRIPQSFLSSATERRLPVVSEEDYRKTQPFTEQGLADLLRCHSMILVGASLDDPPVVRALAATREEARSGNRTRWALLPGHHLTPGTRRLVALRLESLGVRVLFLDYYSQAAQFFRELAVCAQLEAPETYLTPGHSYGQRLTAWWDAWQKAVWGMGLVAAQRKAHELLHETVLPETRKVLTAPSNEVIKIDYWMRWKPSAHRKLRLWATSTGTWNEVSAMRDLSILSDEGVALEAFRHGRPRFDTDSKSRWKSTLAFPVWSLGDNEMLAVMVISSMYHGEMSCLNPESNSGRIIQNYKTMEAGGRALAMPNFYKV
jgi:hypothetical protein